MGGAGREFGKCFILPMVFLIIREDNKRSNEKKAWKYPGVKIGEK